MGAREELAIVAKRAGYGGDVLRVIAGAAVPAMADGDILTDEQVEQVRLGAEILEAIGYAPNTIAGIVDSFKRKYGDDWRFEFWKRMLTRAAAAR